MSIKNIVGKSTVSATPFFFLLLFLVIKTASAQAVEGSFTDPRDGRTYRTVKIGSQTWMAENLNFDTANGTGSWCYGNKPANCDIYGRLYTWNTAIADKGAWCTGNDPRSIYFDYRNTRLFASLGFECDLEKPYQGCSPALPEGGGEWTALVNSAMNIKQGVCPDGWRLPVDDDWAALEEAVGGSSIASAKLKSSAGWQLYKGVPADRDEYGFSALPGGYRTGDYYGAKGKFHGVGNHGAWWTSTQYYSGATYCRGMHFGSKDVYKYDSKNNYGLSVRCVADQ